MNIKNRPVWVGKINELWKQKNIIWLSGVRRAGKTSLCKQLADATYFNCDLMSVQRMLADPEFFWKNQLPDKPVVLDEIHRVADPSLVLKIAADEHPHLRIIATGSSSLHAVRKFRDTLTDRKRTLHLPPVLWQECRGAFGLPDLDRRLLHGGLPGPLLAPVPDPAFFEDWMDSFYARDIQDLFGIRNRTGFLALLKLACLRNGGQLDITDLAKESGLSRPTVMSHLDDMEVAHAIIRIPPWHGGGHREIIRQPRLYAFDTGLVAHVKGFEKIRESDRGRLWENLVLDELRCAFPAHLLHYWRDKSQREIDFVIERTGGQVDTVEAKISPQAYDSEALHVFRKLYPRGRNFVVCPHISGRYELRCGAHSVSVLETVPAASAE
jgi:predicted AAA+ superfamily ATPase